MVVIIMRFFLFNFFFNISFSIKFGIFIFLVLIKIFFIDFNYCTATTELLIEEAPTPVIEFDF